MRRARKPVSMVHTLSTTDVLWERVREKAEAADMSISRYLVERGLSVELVEAPPETTRRPQHLVLTGDEQRDMHRRIGEIAARIAGDGKEDPGTALERIRKAVGFLVNARMCAMVQDGRTREMTAILGGLFGEEEALRITKRFLARMPGQGLQT